MDVGLCGTGSVILLIGSCQPGHVLYLKLGPPPFKAVSIPGPARIWKVRVGLGDYYKFFFMGMEK